MSNTNIISCDPGATGALCLLRKFDDKPTKIFFFDHKNNTTRQLNNWLINADNEMNINMAIIEDVHSLIGMSAKSNFNFGRNLERMHTLLSLRSFGLDLVTPKVWQKNAGVKAIPKGTKRTPVQLKKEVASLAERLYPGCSIYGPKGGLLDGRSDSLLIGHYGLLKYSNELFLR